MQLKGSRKKNVKSCAHFQKKQISPVLKHLTLLATLLLNKIQRNTKTSRINTTSNPLGAMSQRQVGWWCVRSASSKESRRCVRWCSAPKWDTHSRLHCGSNKVRQLSQLEQCSPTWRASPAAKKPICQPVNCLEKTNCDFIPKIRNLGKEQIQGHMIKITVCGG